MRDYLLEPEAGKADAHKSSLNKNRSEMEAALAAYAQRLSPSEAGTYGIFTRELQDYWRGGRPPPRLGPARPRAPSPALPRRQATSRPTVRAVAARQCARP